MNSSLPCPLFRRSLPLSRWKFPMGRKLVSPLFAAASRRFLFTLRASPTTTRWFREPRACFSFTHFAIASGPARSRRPFSICSMRADSAASISPISFQRSRKNRAKVSALSRASGSSALAFPMDFVQGIRSHPLDKIFPFRRLQGERYRADRQGAKAHRSLFPGRSIQRFSVCVRPGLARSAFQRICSRRYSAANRARDGKHQRNFGSQWLESSPCRQDHRFSERLERLRGHERSLRKVFYRRSSSPLHGASGPPSQGRADRNRTHSGALRRETFAQRTYERKGFYAGWNLIHFFDELLRRPNFDA